MSNESSVHVSMREFLRTGKFGAIALGDSVVTLRSVFGEPDHISEREIRRGAPYIVKYGDVEFHLSGEDPQRIACIFFGNWRNLNAGRFTGIDPWFFNDHPQGEGVEAALTAEGVEFRRESPSVSKNGYYLRLSSGVRLMICTSVEPFTWPDFTGLYGCYLQR